MPSGRTIPAAGGIVWRRRSGVSGGRPGVELLTIHRPSYDDWTFPKGKVDPGETVQQTAVREIAEETGVRVRLAHPLSPVEYPVSSGRKHISYWVARPRGEESTFTPNDEVDEVRWVRPSAVADLLTYDHDRTLLEQFRRLRDDDRHRTRTLVVLRHAKAETREKFDGDDLDRPLQRVGRERANDLVAVLGAYGVRRVVSSPAVRCAQTVEPYADSVSTFLQLDDRLSEQTSDRRVDRSVQTLLDRKKPTVLCTHRPTLPAVFEALGLDPVELSPGDGVVIHHRKGRVHATERI